MIAESRLTYHSFTNALDSDTTDEFDLHLQEETMSCEKRERLERSKRLCLQVGVAAARVRSAKMTDRCARLEKSLEEALRAIESMEKERSYKKISQ